MNIYLNKILQVLKLYILNKKGAILTLLHNLATITFVCFLILGT